LAKVIPPVANTNSFVDWITTTNTIVSAFTQTVTLAANTIGDLTSGNGYVNGVFGAANLVGSSLTGGTVTVPATLQILSNTNFAGVMNVAANSNFVGFMNVSVNSSVTVLSIFGNTTTVNTTFAGNNVNFTSNVFVNGTVFRPPSGNTAQRPSGSNGYVRFNTDLGLLEIFNGATWNFMSTGNTTLASVVSFTPTGNIAANTVQAAIVETYAEKVSVAGDIMNGGLAINLNGVALPTPPVGTVLQIGQADSSTTREVIDSFGAPSALTGRRADGLNSGKTALVSNDEMFGVGGSGFDGTNYSANDRAKIAFFASENWSAANNGTFITLETTAPGTNARAVYLKLNSTALTVNTALTILGNTNGTNFVVSNGIYGSLLNSTNFVANTNTFVVSGNSSANNISANTISSIIINGSNTTLTDTLTANSYVGNNATITVSLIVNGTANLNSTTNANNIVVANTVTTKSLVANTITGQAIATIADYRSANAGKVITTDVAYGAMALVALTSAATIVWDLSTGIDFSLTLATNATLAFPTNGTIGKKGSIRVLQDATGSRTLAKGTNIKTVGGNALTLSTAAGTIDWLDYHYVSNTECRISISKAWS
jgi:hypothetical protein